MRRGQSSGSAPAPLHHPWLRFAKWRPRGFKRLPFPADIPVALPVLWFSNRARRMRPMLALAQRPRLPTTPAASSLQDVAEEIGGDQHIEPLGVHYQIVGGGIHEHIVVGHAAVRLCYLPAGLGGKRTVRFAGHWDLWTMVSFCPGPRPRPQATSAILSEPRARYHPQGARLLQPDLFQAGVKPLCILPPRMMKSRSRDRKGPDVGIRGSNVFSQPAKRHAAVVWIGRPWWIGSQ